MTTLSGVRLQFRILSGDQLAVETPYTGPDRVSVLAIWIKKQSRDAARVLYLDIH